MIETLLVLLENLQTIGLIAALALGIGLGLGTVPFVMYTVDGYEDDAAKFKKILSKIIPFFILSLFIAIIPRTDDLWRVRINLIKLSLASPENLTKAASELEKISKGLECKYLNACESKKK